MGNAEIAGRMRCGSNSSCCPSDMFGCYVEESGMDVFRESYLRANIIAWLPIERKESVLYIGKEDVAAAKFREMSGDVVCVAQAGKIPVDGKFDYIICLGNISKTDAGVFAAHLKSSGRLVLAVENAYGLKYLAGVKEIGSKEYFGAVEAVEGSVGWTKEEIARNLTDAGFLGQRFYYPFPDFEIAMSIYSDEYLPKAGELIDQIGNFDAERLVLFDEVRAADALVTRQKFPEFSSSYLIVAEKEVSSPVLNQFGEDILFVKFSNDRGLLRNIRTYITRSQDGTRHLIKAADTKAANPHLKDLEKKAKQLCNLYENSRFLINACRQREDGMVFEFLCGQTMEEILDRMLAEGAYERARETLLEILTEIGNCSRLQEFHMSEDFERVFGNPGLKEGLLAASVSDIDMILPNILVDGDGRWNVIDYEWSFHFPVPVHFIMYRCIRYYAETTEERRRMDAGSLYEKVGITEEELAAYEHMEEAFQEYVLDGHIPMRQLYKEYGMPAYHISSILNIVDEQERRRALQVYFDRGNGFSEEESVFYHSKALDGTYKLEIPVGEDVKQLRIDPGSQACTVDIAQLCWKAETGGTLDFISNGHRLTAGMYLFDTEDPNLLIMQVPAGKKTLLLDMRIDSMSLAAAEWIAPKIDAKYRLKKMWKK